tara:strand:+ start:716 stop:1546 length:831 start_codon:yes stop_codon:yes gene_type:complete
MGFKLKSQKAVKQGGFKFMGSSPMKEDDVTAKISSIPDNEKTNYFLDDQGNPIQVSIGEVDIVEKKASPIADAINKATKVKPRKLNIDYKPKPKKKPTSSTPRSGDVTVKTRTVNDVKDVEKRTYKTVDGSRVREKKKFSPSGEVVKTKKKVRKGDTITKTKTKGGKTKTKVRKAGSLLNEEAKKKISSVKNKAKNKITKIKESTKTKKSNSKSKPIKSETKKSNKSASNNANSASSTDQMIAKKKFQNKMGGIIPKDTKVTYNKDTGRYTYSSEK